MGVVGAVQQRGRVGMPEDGVATSLDLVAMATLLPAPKGAKFEQVAVVSDPGLPQNH